MNSKKKIVIFSGSSEGTGEYAELAKKIGAGLAQIGFTVVNGGGPGLMEVVARSAFEKGGEVIGVHYEFEGRESSRYNTQTLNYKDLNLRQQKLISLADAFVILPGGLGTLFEFIEILAKKYVKELDCTIPIILVAGDYWKDLRKMLNKQIEKGFMKKEILSDFQVVDSQEDAIAILEHNFNGV